MMRAGVATLSILLLACGATYRTAPVRAAPSPAPPSAPLELTVALDPTPIHGARFEPTAMDRPSMPLVEPTRPATLDELRRAARSATTFDDRRVAVQALATALYQASRAAGDEAAARAVRDEARRALAELRAAAGGAGRVGEVPLQMLAVLDMADHDYGAADEVFDELDAWFPTGTWAAADHAWDALCLLRLGKTGDALAALDGVAASAHDPERAYVLAWARWRSGDAPGAVSAMTAAARGWTSAATRPRVIRDLAVMLARGPSSASQAVAAISTADERGAQLADLFELDDALAVVGRWRDAIAVFDTAIARGDAASDADVARIRALEARYATRALDGARVATLAQQAVVALARCGDACPSAGASPNASARTQVVQTVHDLALLFHDLYATSFDRRLLDPARALYASYAELPDRPDAAVMQQHARDLELVARRARPARGAYDKSLIAQIVARHVQEIQACYDDALDGDASFAGALVLHLVFDGDGRYVRGSATPTTDAGVLGRVAGCSLRAVARWPLPRLDRPAVTHVEAAYALSPGV